MLFNNNELITNPTTYSIFLNKIYQITQQGGLIIGSIFATIIDRVSKLFKKTPETYVFEYEPLLSTHDIPKYNEFRFETQPESYSQSGNILSYSI